MSHFSEHQTAHTKIVKQALKAVARQNNFSYPSVFADFVAGNNPSCTQCFWENFCRLFPDTPWHYVSFYHSCRLCRITGNIVAARELFEVCDWTVIPDSAGAVDNEYILRISAAEPPR